MKIISFQAIEAQVNAYIHEDYDTLIAHKVRPAMVICPGGAYQ